MRRRVFFAVFVCLNRRIRARWSGFPSIQPLSLASLASSPGRGASGEAAKLCGMPRPLPLGEVSPQVTERACNQTVAFFTLFSKIKGKLKNVLLKKWRICVTLHPSCNGIFGDSGVFSPVFYGSGGRRQSDSYAFFLLFCPFWLFSGHLALWQGGKYGKIV